MKKKIAQLALVIILYLMAASFFIASPVVAGSISVLADSTAFALASGWNVQESLQTAQESVQTFEPDFYSMFDGHGLPMLLIDSSSGEILYANEAAASLYGYSKSELTSLLISDINTLSPQQIASEMQAAVAENRNFFRFEHRLASGDLRQVEVYSYPYDRTGRPLLFSIIHDVTAEVRLAAANRRMMILLLSGAAVIVLILAVFLFFVRRANQQLRRQAKEIQRMDDLRRSFIDSDDRLVYLKDENLKYLFVNKAFEKYYGMKAADVIGQDDFAISDQNFARMRQESDRAVLENRQRLEKDVEWKDRIYRIIKFPIELESGAIGLGAYIRDVTERRQLGRMAEKTLQRHAIMVEVLNHDFASSDQQLSYALEKALELTESEIGYIFLYDTEKEEFVINTWSSSVMDRCGVIEPQTRYQLAKTGLWGEAVRQRRPIIDNDYKSSGPLKKGCPPGHVEMTTYMTVPLIMDEIIVAVVGLANKKNGYDSVDVDQISILMAGVWGAIERNDKKLALAEANGNLEESRSELKLLLDSTAEGIYGIDLQGCCTMINASGLRMLGYEHEQDLIGLNMHDQIHYRNNDGSFMPMKDCKVNEALRQGRGVQVEGELFWRKDGTGFEVEYFSYPQYKEGRLIGAVVTFMDITDRRRMEQAVYSEKEQFRTTLLSVGDAVMSTDERGHIVLMNPVAEQLTGWNQSDAQGKPFDLVFHIINEFTRDLCENPVERVLELGEIIELANHTILIARDGREIPIEDSAAPIKDRHGRISGVVVVFRDFSDKKEKMREIEYLSFHDHLTGLYNRRYMEDSISRLDTSRNLPFAVMTIDVNGLKLTNDAFGHKAGDELLVKVADMLRSVCRAEELIGRMGGDEFVVLLPGTDVEHAAQIKKRIIKAAAQIELDSVIVSLAVGFAIKENADQNIADVMTVADNNMYKDKLRYGKIMRSKTIETVLKNINLKYDQEQIHTERVSQYCEAIAQAMELSEKEVQDIKTAAVLHDIGKIMVPPEILNKPGRLTQEEFNIVKRHPETSYQILKSVDEYSALAEVVLYHHERPDGSGYPEGLILEKIPLFSRIISVADTYEAMTAKRPYQTQKSKEEAVRELLRVGGTQLDAEIVRVFVEKVLKLRPDPNSRPEIV